MFLSRLRRRALLDRGRAELAEFLQLASHGDVSASTKWRTFLAGEDGQIRTDGERLRVAQEALTTQGTPTPTPDHIRTVLDNPDAMRLLTERDLAIHRFGNTIAHPLMEESLLHETVTRTGNGPSERAGLLGIHKLLTNSSST